MTALDQMGESRETAPLPVTCKLLGKTRSDEGKTKKKQAGEGSNQFDDIMHGSHKLCVMAKERVVIINKRMVDANSAVKRTE